MRISWRSCGRTASRPSGLTIATFGSSTEFGSAIPSPKAAVALALFAAGLATRLPLGTTNLWAHDSVLYERAIERFDPADQRPQAPGYLYYVLLLRALVALTGDANRAMTLVSAFAGAGAVALLYLFVRRLYDERTAIIAALFLFTSVTFWAYGGVAYPYTLLALLTIGCAALFWRAAEGPDRRARLVLASVAWGVAIGFRADLALFLAPIWLMAAWRAGLAWSAAAAGAFLASVGLWIGLSAAMSAIGPAQPGGVERFLAANEVQSRFIQDRYSVFGGGARNVARNAYDLARFLARALYALIPLVGALVLSRDALRTELRDRRRVLFLALWTLAPLPFYLLIHVGEYGYVFTMLPGLCVLAARGAIALAKAALRPRLLPWVVAAAVLFDAGVFLFSDTPLSRNDLAKRDFGITEKVAYVRARVAPQGALVVTPYEGVIVQRYLGPDYRLATYDPDAAPPSRIALPAGTTLVAWDDLLRVDGAAWQTVTLAHGARLRIARLEDSRALEVAEGLLLRVAER